MSTSRESARKAFRIVRFCTYPKRKEPTTRIAPLAARSYQPPPSVSPASTFEIEARPPPRSGDQHARAERRVTQAEADGGAARCAAIGASRAAALAAVAAWLAPIYTPRPGASVREEQRWPPARRFSLRKYRGRRAHVFVTCFCKSEVYRMPSEKN